MTAALSAHESQLAHVEEQQRRMVESVRREARALESRRRGLQRQLEMERARLAAVEERAREVQQELMGVAEDAESVRSSRVGGDEGTEQIRNSAALNVVRKKHNNIAKGFSFAPLLL